MTAARTFLVRPSRRRLAMYRNISMLALCALLVACGGGNRPSAVRGAAPACMAQPEGPYALHGTVTGFRGRLRLVDQAGEVLELQGAGPFRFSRELAGGERYQVRVAMQPPAQYCEVTAGSGIAGADMPAVTVRCQPGRIAALHLLGGLAGEFPAAFPGAFPYVSPPVQLGAELYAMASDGGTHMQGVVLRLRADGSTAVLHSFDDQHALRMVYPLTPGGDGNLYGLTASGGANGLGSVFRITPQGQYTLLHSFAIAVQDGALPTSGLLRASDGWMYGLTLLGGAHGCGTLYRIDEDGQFQVLHSFAGPPGEHSVDSQLSTVVSEQGKPLRCAGGTLVEGEPGALFGVALRGGEAEHGGIFRYDLHDGTLRTLVSAPATLPTLGGDLMRASDGHLYFATQDSGTPGAVYRVTLQGELSLRHRFAASGCGPRRPQGALLQASDGRLYGVSALGGLFEGGTLYRYAPDDDSVEVLHHFGLPLSLGQHPANGLALAADGSLYGSTCSGSLFGAGAVFRVD